MLLLVLCPFVAADVVISDYPFFFVHDDIFDAKYVVGDEAPSMDVITATILSTNLARFDDFQTAVGTTLLDSEVDDITRINAIVIGNPCSSSSAADLEGNPADCYDGLDDETGYVKVFRHGNKVQLLITGITPEDRQVVAKRLAKLSLDNVNRSVYSMSTNTGSRLPRQQDFHQQITSQAVKDTGSAPVVERVPEEAVEESMVKKEIEKSSYSYDPIQVVRPEKKGFFARFFSAIARFFGSIFG